MRFNISNTSTAMITELTPEQEALIPIYWEKWRAIAFSTQRIDKEKAAEAVKTVYAAIRKQQPEVLFCDSPYAAWKMAIQLKLKSRLNSEVERQLLLDFGKQLHSLVAWKLHSEVVSKMQLETALDLLTQVQFSLEEKLKSELKNQLQLHTNLRDPWIISPQWSFRSCWYDFCLSVLNCAYEQKKWLAQQSLVQHCGWTLPYEKICIVSDRPTKLSFDNQNRLHAEGEPAIQFTDGYSLYSYHGETLPEKYGQVHPNQWKAQWLLEEEDAEVRRVLVQAIGYAQICQELQATELDNWKEYTLLRIDADLDGFGEKEKEPVHLLKMTCLSTGHIHVMRLPPEIDSAREAIRWVNGDIDPEEFSVKTRSV